MRTFLLRVRGGGNKGGEESGDYFYFHHFQEGGYRKEEVCVVSFSLPKRGRKRRGKRGHWVGRKKEEREEGRAWRATRYFKKTKKREKKDGSSSIGETLEGRKKKRGREAVLLNFRDDRRNLKEGKEE